MAQTSGKKRSLDDASGTPKQKKTKTDHPSKKSKAASPENAHPSSSNLASEEVDFPRGGGTTFTPLEVKAIHAEVAKEAKDVLFAEKETRPAKRKRKSDVKDAEKKGSKAGDRIRVEHLNYKRVTTGMRILGQIVSVEPLALIVSLPNLLYGHVPITNISTELTTRLESMDEDAESSEDEEDEDEVSSKRHVPELSEIFRPGQYVRTVVTNIHAPGSSDTLGMGRPRDEAEKASRRVELSLVPEKVNEGVAKTDLKKGFVLSAAVKSIEDHGYILNMGVPDFSGFLSFKDAEASSPSSEKLPVGHLLDVCISKLSSNGRTCTVTIDQASLASSSLTEVSNVRSLVPGSLVQCLVTGVISSGLNLQVLGYFGGTIDQYHLAAGAVEANYKLGQKLKARILYDVTPSTPPKFALSLAGHVLSLKPKTLSPSSDDGESHDTSESYPVGTVLDSVKVIRVESENGLIVELSPTVHGFVHISQTSDDHVPTLSSSSGPWKIDTFHRARVTGYFPFDGLLQLSMRPSVLEKKFLQVGEVQVGEIVKGTIKRLTDTGLFVSISGSVDAVVWPNHYADIQLKHPQKRFKPGASIKCRILVVNPDRKRIALTAKKSLIESTLPIISSTSDLKIGHVTHAVVFRVLEKGLQIEFYNNIKAFVPFKEASDTPASSLADSFPIGKVVKARIQSVDPDTGNIIASLRQASTEVQSIDMSAVEIGSSVQGIVKEVQKDKIILTLQPSNVTALLSLNNLANRRGVVLSQLRASLKVGEALGDLVVTTRNPEKGFVLVATKAKEKESLNPKGLTIDAIEVGQVLRGRVLRHIRQGALVKVTSNVTGTLHPTDTCDDYEAGKPFPSDGTALTVAVVAIDKEKKQLVLSTRSSRVEGSSDVVDKEINTIGDLEVGSSIRGFVKSVAEHGLFVTVGRGIDARVQIKELFDDYVKDWKSRFSVNQLVKGRILKVDREKNQIELSFRSANAGQQDSSHLTLADISEGDKVDGIIKKIEDYGLFIEIAGSKLRGLCHKSEVSDSKDADVTLALRSFREGDRVKAKILSVDTEKRRISLGLKPSYFGEDDFQSDEDDEVVSDGERVSLGVVDGDNADNDVEADAASEAEPEKSSDEEEEDTAAMDVDVDIQTSLSRPLAATSVANTATQHTLQLSKGFKWSAEHNDEDASMASSSEDEDGDEPSKKRKKRKVIVQDLTADMHSKRPESNADFERLLLGSPNSSYLWIQYMGFQLQLSEVEKAREVAKRALKTINFREEQEKLNVWIALLNLENVYGTEESLEATFKDAARHNDSKTVYLRLASIFVESEKLENAEEQFKKTCKKFGQSSKVWSLFGEYYLKHGKTEEARALLARSLQSLEKRKHLKTISKFAQLEYKFGEPERGKTIFEGIVDSHPKRWDLWSIYLDMEAGQGDIISLRNLFERVLSVKMTSHKAKSFFKKWLELEKRLGDEEGESIVKAKAVEWTQRAAGES